MSSGSSTAPLTDPATPRLAPLTVNAAFIPSLEMLMVQGKVPVKAPVSVTLHVPAAGGKAPQPHREAAINRAREAMRRFMTRRHAAAKFVSNEPTGAR